MARRTIAFALWAAAVGLLCGRFLYGFIHISLEHGYSSQSVLVPFIALFLIWTGRQKIFRMPQYSFAAGIALAILGFTAFSLGWVYPGPAQMFTAEAMRLSGVFLMIAGGFIGLYGWAAFRAALFPFFLLLLMLPLPTRVVDRIIAFLQEESTTLSYGLFSLLGVPVYREGFILRLPGVSIEVAQECSGINSSVALLLTALLVAWETLRTTSRRVILLLLTIPLSVIKNAVRIVSLTLLALYVDPSFLTGKLHHDGGFVFFVIALALVYPIWSFLYKTEQAKPRGASQPPAAEAASSVAGR